MAETKVRSWIVVAGLRLNVEHIVRYYDTGRGSVHFASDASVHYSDDFTVPVTIETVDMLLGISQTSLDERVQELEKQLSAAKKETVEEIEKHKETKKALETLKAEQATAALSLVPTKKRGFLSIFTSENT